MKFKCVATSHTNPTLSGVAKFNHILAQMLEVPCVGIEDLCQQNQGPILLSVKLQEDIYSDWRTLRDAIRHLAKHNIVYDLFFHTFDHLEIEYELANNAKRIFCGSAEITHVLQRTNKEIISAWCPALLRSKGVLGESTFNIFSFGMAHKIQVKYYKILRELLQKHNISYSLRVSTAFHEKANFGDFNSISQQLTEIFGDNIQFMGFLSDDAVNYFLNKSHLFITFFDKAVRAGNTSVYAAMERGCTVLTNCDDFSPDWMKHGENMLDINFICKDNFDINNLERIGYNGRQCVEKYANWQGLLKLLNTPSSINEIRAAVPALNSNRQKQACLPLDADASKPVNTKIQSKENISSIATEIKKQKKKIVFTSGCFDILHLGHLRFLQTAKTFGDILILALNSDDSIKRVKGPGRPIINQHDRAELLLALGYIDYIVFLNANTACNMISEIRPDIYVKGNDYNQKDYEEWPESKIVKDYGGEIKFVNLVKGRSTTDTIDRIHRTINTANQEQITGID